MIFVLSIIRFKRGMDLWQFKEWGLCWMAGLLAPIVLMSMTSICFAQNGWTQKADILTPRWYLSSCVVSGKIYAIGGVAASYNKVEEYDPATDTWTTKKPMPTGRAFLVTSAVNGKIYTIGGGTSFQPGSGIAATEVYDPVTDTWISKADMPTPRTVRLRSGRTGAFWLHGK